MKVFSELCVEDCQDYEKLKKAILTAYELCPEVYRKRFRSSRKLATETHADFAFKLTQAFKRWLNGVKTWNNVEQLRETFLMEQFMESIPTELKLWLNDRDPKTLDEMSRLADQFVVLRKAVNDHDHHETMLVSSRPVFKSTRPWQSRPKSPTQTDKIGFAHTAKLDEVNKETVR
jgi:hypothetical protein